jgi:hypothetical protein
MVTCDTGAIAEWLVDGARSALSPDLVLAELCERLVNCDIPLWRVAVFVRTLHPDVLGRRFLWQLGSSVSTSEACRPWWERQDMNVGAVRMSCHAQLAHLVDETAAFDFTEVFGWSF